MTRKSGRPQARAGLTPEGTFVVQLRSDSNVARRRLNGRVEHVMSGCSEPFTSLADLLAFIDRYAEAEKARTSATEAKDEGERRGK